MLIDSRWQSLSRKLCRPDLGREVARRAGEKASCTKQQVARVARHRLRARKPACRRARARSWKTRGERGCTACTAGAIAITSTVFTEPKNFVGIYAAAFLQTKSLPAGFACGAYTRRPWWPCALADPARIAQRSALCDFAQSPQSLVAAPREEAAGRCCASSGGPAGNDPRAQPQTADRYLTLHSFAYMPHVQSKVREALYLKSTRTQRKAGGSKRGGQ